MEHFKLRGDPLYKRDKCSKSAIELIGASPALSKADLSPARDPEVASEGKAAMPGQEQLGSQGEQEDGGGLSSNEQQESVIPQAPEA